MSRAFSALKWKISGFRKAQSLRTRARSRRQAAGAVPASAGKLPVPCPLRSFTLALFCSFGSHSRRSWCISGALQRLLLQTLIYFTRRY